MGTGVRCHSFIQQIRIELLAYAKPCTRSLLSWSFWSTGGEDGGGVAKMSSQRVSEQVHFRELSEKKTYSRAP